MKKVVSIFLVLMLTLALSGMVFADVPDGITAEMYQQCVDDTPEGCYLASVNWTVDGNVTNVEALYMPLTRATVYPSKVISLWYESSVVVLQYTLSGVVNCDGTTATVNVSSCTKTYEIDDGQYSVDTTPAVKQASSGNPAVIKGYFYFDVYEYGVYQEHYERTGTLYCDAYGNYW